MKKKLIAFLVLVIAVCSLFTACVKTKASEALKHNGNVAEAEITETVGMDEGVFDFNSKFTVEDGFSIEVKKGGVVQGNLAALPLDPGMNVFDIVVSGNKDTANFVLRVKRNKKFTITIKKVVDGVVVDGGTVDYVEEGSGSYTVPEGKKPEFDANKEVFDRYRTGASMGSMPYVAGTINKDTEIFAHFTTKEFAVSFDGVSTNLKYGAAIVAPTPSDADKDTAQWDYTFDGWKVEGTENDAIVDFDGLTVTGAVKYVSVWSKELQTYTVKFDGVAQDVAYGNEAEVPADPTKPNEGTIAYTFEGWVVDKDGDGVADADETEIVTDFTVSGDVDYVAKYSESVAGFVVKFDGVAQNVASGGTAIAPADSTPADTAEWDYAFAGWVLDANGNGIIDAGEEIVSDFSNVTANAEYVTSYTKTKKSYSVSFNGVASTLEYGEAISAPATNPSKNEDVAYTYTFAGWKVEGTADTDLVTDFGTVTGEVAYVPVFNRTLRKYAVSFDGESANLDYGSAIVAPAPKDLDDEDWDYTFKGWKVEGTADSSAIVDFTGKTVSGAVSYVSVYTKVAKGYVINLPANQVGYTITTDKNVYKTGETAKITCALDEHYDNDTSEIVVTVGGVEYTYDDIYNAQGVLEVEIANSNVGVTVEGVKINVYTLTVVAGDGFTIGGSLSGNALTSTTLTINYDAHYDAIVDGVVVTVGDATFSYADGSIDYGTNQFTVELVDNANVEVTGVVANVYTYNVEYRTEAVTGAYSVPVLSDDVDDTFDLTADEVEDIASNISAGEGFEFNNYELSENLITIYYNRTRHDVSFKGFDGVEIDGYTVTDVKYGSPLTVPAAPEVSNPDPEKVYTFAGWKVEGADDSTAAMITTVTETAVYVPVYTSVDKTYTITLPAVQTGYTASVDVAEGKKGDAYTITVVIDENYSKCVMDMDVFFNGVSNMGDWSFDFPTLTATYNGTFEEDIEVTTTDLVENVYTISYASDAAYTVSGTLSGKKGDAYEIVITLNEGYRNSFANVVVSGIEGEQSKDDATFTITVSGTFAVNGDATLVVSGYEQDAGYITIEYQVEDIAGGAYSVNNDKSYTAQFTTFGNTEIEDAKIEIEGFTFEEVVVDGLIEEEGVYVGGKLIVKYTRNTYTIDVYDENGENVVDSQSFKYGADITVADAIKADDGEKYYVFAGWIDLEGNPVELSTMGANNIEIAPVFEEKIREYELVLPEFDEDIAYLDVYFGDKEDGNTLASGDMLKKDDTITLVVEIWSSDYDRSIPKAVINGNEIDFVADETNVGIFELTMQVVKEYTADGKLVIDIIGIEENTYTVTLPEEQVGYTAKVIADSYTYDSQFKVLISLEKEYNKSTPVVTINGVFVSADEDGYYVGTINGDMIVDITGIAQNTYSVTGSGDLDTNGYEIVDIDLNGEAAVQNAEFTFKVNVAPAYNQSIGAMKVYYVGASGAKVPATEVDGVYTGKVNGNTTIVVEGLTKNVYTATGTVVLANQDATYKRVSSLSDVDYYLNGEKQAGVTDEINLTLEVGVPYSIEYRNKITDEVIYSKEFTIEEGDEDINFGTIYLGNFNVDGYEGTANGQVCDISYNGDGWLDTTMEGDFVAEYTMKVDAANSTETDPAVGFVLRGGTGETASLLRFGILKSGVRMVYSGSADWNDRVSSLEMSTLIGVPVRSLIQTGATFKLVRSGDVFFFYVNGTAAFALDTVNGFVGISNNTLSATDVENTTIKNRLTSILASGNITVGIWSSVNPGVTTMDRTITKVSAADSISHAINNSKLTTYGHIYNPDDYDASNGKMGGNYGYLLPGATDYVKYTDANGNDGITAGICHLDLSTYKGALMGQNIKVKISPFDTAEDLSTVSLQTRNIGGEWSEVVDITNDLVVSGTESYYTIQYEVGKEYRFYTTFATASVKTTVAFNVQDTDGVNLEGLNYIVYKKNADGSSGAMVQSGVTGTVNVGTTAYLAAVMLGEGEYIINIDGGGKAFGRNIPLTVTKTQASSGQTVVLDTVVLDKNIWGSNTSGATAYYNTTSQENYSVRFEGLNAVTAYTLDQKLTDNSIIKVSLKLNDGSDGTRAHGLYSSSGDSYTGPWSHATTTIGDCDMYIKNNIDKTCFATETDPMGAAGLGIGASGNTWGAGRIDVNASPLNDVVDQFVIAGNYDVSYDFAYARILEEQDDGSLVPYVYLLVKYGTAKDYTVVSKREAGKMDGVYTTESTLELAVSNVNPFYQNFTWYNFSYEATGAKDLIDTSMQAEASPGAVGYDEATDTYSATIAGDGRVYISDVRGDKTQGIFTIEADIEASSVGAYAMRGFMMVDPKTGKFVNIGPRDTLYGSDKNGQMYASVAGGNGYAYRLFLNYSVDTTLAPVTWVTSGNDHKGNPNENKAHIAGLTLLPAGETANFYLKAVVEGDYWTIYGGATKETAVKLYAGDLRNAYESQSTAGGHGWADDSETLFPTANVVAMGMASFGDNTEFARYTNVKVTYTSYVDMEKPAAIEEVINYAANYGISLTEESAELAEVKAATSMTELETAVDNAKAVIDFYKRRIDAAADLSAWAEENTDFTSTLTVIATDKEGILAAEDDDALAAAVVAAQFTVGKRGAQADFDAWYVDQADEIAGVIAGGEKTQNDFDAAKVEADAVIGATTVYSELVPSIAAAKNVIKAVLDSTLGGAKNAAIAAIEAVGASYELTEYGANELAAAKTVAINALNNCETVEEIELAQPTLVAQVEAVATKVNNTFDTVTFVNDGETYETLTSVKYGTVISVADASKASSATTDYTFAGWSDGSAVVEVITTDTITATYIESARVYTISASNGTGYTVSVASEAANGATVTMVITLEDKYNRSQPTVTAGSATAELVSTEGNVLTYSFVMPAENATIAVSGVTMNTYAADFNLYIASDQNIPLLASGSKVDLYVDDVLVTSATASGKVSAQVSVAESHTYSFKVGSDVWASGSFTIAEGGANYTKDIFVGYAKLSNALFTQKADGLHNNHMSEGINNIVGLDGELKLFDNVAVEYTVTTTAGTEADAGYGFIIRNADNTKYAQVLFMRKGLRIIPSGGWSSRVGLEGNVLRENDIRDEVKGGVTLKVVRKGTTLYFFYNGDLEFSLSPSAGLTAYGFSAVSHDMMENLKTELSSVLAGQIIVGVSATFSAADSKTLYNTYTNFGYTSDATAIENAYVAQVTGDSSNITFSNNVYNNITSGTVISGLALNVTVTNPTDKKIIDLKVNGTSVEFTKNATGATYTFTPEAGKTYAFTATYEDAASAANLVATISDSKSGTYYVGATYTLINSASETVYSGTIDSATLSMPVDEAGTYTLELGWTDYAAGKSVAIEVTEDQIKAGSNIPVSIVLQYVEWGNNVNVTEYTRNIGENGYELAIKTQEMNISYTLDPKLSNGKMIKYSVKFGADMSKNAAKTACEVVSHDPFMKNTVGGKILGITSKSLVVTGNGVDASMVGVKGAPFGAFMTEIYRGNFDLVYDFAYAQVDGVVYLLAKLSTQSTYAVVSKMNAPASENTLVLHMTSAGGSRWHDYTYSNFEIVTNATTINNLISAGQADTITNHTQLNAITVTEEDGDYTFLNVGAGGAYLPSVVGNRTTGTFEISADVDIKQAGAYPGVGVVIADPSTGKMVNAIFNGNTGKNWMFSVANGNGWGKRITLDVDGRDASCQTIGLVAGTKFAFKAVVSGDVVQLYVNGKLAGYKNMVDVFKSKATNDGTVWTGGIENLYPSNNIGIGLYSWSDGTCVTEFYNIKASYTPNVTYLADAKASAKAEVDAYVASEINGIMDGYTYSSTSYTNIDALTYAAGDVLGGKVTTAIAADKVANMNAAVAASKAVALEKLEAAAGGAEFVTTEMTSLINSSTTVKEVANNLDAAIALADSYVLGGIVTNANGEAISGATVAVSVDGTVFSTTTGTDGSYSLKVGTGEATTITVSANGYHTKANLAYTDTNADEQSQNFVLNPIMIVGTNNDANNALTYTADTSDALGTVSGVSYNVYSNNAGSNHTYNVVTLLADGASFSYNFKFNGPSEGKLGHEDSINGTDFDGTNTNGDMYLKNSVGGISTHMNSRGQIYANTGYTTTGAQPFDYAFMRDFLGGNVYSDVSYDMMYVRTGTEVKHYAKFGGTDYWVHVGTATLTSTADAKIVLQLSSRGSNWINNYTYSNLEYNASGATSGFLTMNYGADTADKPYGAYGKYVKAEGDQYNRYDIHVGPAENAARANVVLSDAALDATAGTVVIETKATGKIAGLYNGTGSREWGMAGFLFADSTTTSKALKILVRPTNNGGKFYISATALSNRDGWSNRFDSLTIDKFPLAITKIDETLISDMKAGAQWTHDFKIEFSATGAMDATDAKHILKLYVDGNLALEIDTLALYKNYTTQGAGNAWDKSQTEYPNVASLNAGAWVAIDASDDKVTNSMFCKNFTRKLIANA